MRDADGIDPLSPPLTPEEVQRLAREREYETAMAGYREQKRLQQEATERAKGTPEAQTFEDLCIEAAEAAVEAYASGQTSFTLEHDFRKTEVPRKLLGIKVGTKKVEDIEKHWKYFRVRVLVNGKLENAIGWNGDESKPLEHPYHDGFVVVMEINAPWIEEAVTRSFDEAGYQRTTYVSTFQGRNQVMAFKLAYALPTSDRTDRPSD